MELSQLPYIYIEIDQPGNKGNFFVNVYDGQNKQKILTNQLKENISYLEYTYTSRLLEGGGMGMRTRDEKLAERQKLERYEDIVRYGQRIYSELFGKDNQLKKYLVKQSYFANGARYVLRLHSTASELWNIPWEYIHDGAVFVAIQPQYPITRSLLDTKLEREGIDWKNLPNPLRVLCLVSNPYDVPPLNVDAEIARMRDAVQDAEEQGLIELDFVEEGTLENLEAALQTGQHHVLHYSGHGALAAQGSYLVFENAAGFSEPVFLNQLLPILEKSANLRFVFLSACRTGNIAEMEASSGIATGMLTKIPAVLAMQYAIRDDRATELSAAFYGSIAKGNTLEQATHDARLAMYQTDNDLNDWGVPALYTQRPNMRLLNPTSTGQVIERSRFDLSILPEAQPFVGRQHERRVLRAAIHNPEIPMVYLWGLAGIGKSGLIRHMLARPNKRDSISDVLVLRCEQSQLREMLNQIIDWLKRHFPQAKEVLEANAPMLQRLKAASQVIKDKRLILVLDRFDSLMKPQENRQWDISHPQLAEVFQFLATAKWSILTIFVSRSRWTYLANIPKDKYVDIHLDSLLLPDIIFMMQQLEHLKAIDLKVIRKFFNQVGGHPLTLRLINQYLEKYPEKKELDSPYFTEKLADLWHKAFLGSLFASLLPEEQEALRLLSIHHDVFNAQHVQMLVTLPEQADAERIIAGWEALSLAYHLDNDAEGVAWYNIPHLVRTYVSNLIEPRNKPEYHARVAQVVQNSFYKAAEGYFKRAGGMEVKADAPYEAVMAYLRVAMIRAPAATLNRHMDLVYTWYTHCREAHQISRAVEVALIVMPMLDMFGIDEQRSEVLEWLLKNTQSNTPHHIETLYWQAVCAVDTEDYEQAEKLLQGVVKASQTYNADEIGARSMTLAALMDRNRGKRQDAARKWESVLKVYTRLNNYSRAASTYLYLGEMAYFNNDQKGAARYIDDGLKLFRQAQNIDVDGRIYGRLLLYRGHIHRDIKNDNTALQFYREVLRIGQSFGDAYLIGKGLENMGYLYGLLRQYDMAAQYLLQALHIYENVGDMVSLVVVLARLAMMYNYKDNQDDALVFAARAQTLAAEYAPTSVSQIENMARQFKRRKRLGF